MRTSVDFSARWCYNRFEHTKGRRSHLCKSCKISPSGTPRASDADRVVELLDYIAQIHREGRPDLFIGSGGKFDREAVLALFADEHSPVFVADDGETVVGYIICRLRSTPSNPSLRPIRTLYVEDLCVDPAHAGRGVGSALMRRAEDCAREAGCYNIDLNVWAFNTEAIAFYEKNGYAVQRSIMEKRL